MIQGNALTPPRAAESMVGGLRHRRECVRARAGPDPTHRRHGPQRALASARLREDRARARRRPRNVARGSLSGAPRATTAQARPANAHQQLEGARPRLPSRSGLALTIHLADLLAPAGEPPTQWFRILRASDLVVLDVVATESNWSMMRAPALVAETVARLEVHFTFQHPPRPLRWSRSQPAAASSRAGRPPEQQARAGWCSTCHKGCASSTRRPACSVPSACWPCASPRWPRSRPAARLRGLLKDAPIVSVVLPGGVRLARTADGLAVLPQRQAAADRPRGSVVADRCCQVAAPARTMLTNERAVDFSGLRLAESASFASDLGRLMLPPELVRPVRATASPAAIRRDRHRDPVPPDLSPSVHGGFTHATEPRTLASPGAG